MNRISKHKDDAAASLQERLRDMERDVRPFLEKKQPQQPSAAFASKVSTGRQPVKHSRTANLAPKESPSGALRKGTSLTDLSTCLAELDGLPAEESMYSDVGDVAWGDVQEVEEDISRLQTALTWLRHGPNRKVGDTAAPLASPTPARNTSRPPHHPPARRTAPPNQRKQPSTPCGRTPVKPVNIPQTASTPSLPSPYARQARGPAPVRELSLPRRSNLTSSSGMRPETAQEDGSIAAARGNVRREQGNPEPRASTPTFGIEEWERSSASVEDEPTSSAPQLTFRAFNHDTSDARGHVVRKDYGNAHEYVASNQGYGGDRVFVPSSAYDIAPSSGKEAWRHTQSHSAVDHDDKNNTVDDAFSGPLSDLINRQAEDLRRMLGS